MTQKNRHVMEITTPGNRFTEDDETWTEYQLTDESTLYFENGEENGEFFSADPKNVHIEQMGSGLWWVGIDLPDGKRLSVNFYSKKPIHISWREDV